MKARELARNGLLTGVTVALLYLGGASAVFSATACMAASVSSTIPLLRHANVRAAVQIYLASSLLALALVPRKSVVLMYGVACGPYPILKYGIECYIPRFWQWCCKLICANLFLAIALIVAHYVFLITFSISTKKRLFYWCAANLFFAIYDVGLSRLIATLRKTLPPE